MYPGFGNCKFPISKQRAEVIWVSYYHSKQACGIELFVSQFWMTLTELSLSLSFFPDIGWWFPILLRVRQNLNWKRGILYLFIRNVRTAGSKAHCSAMGKRAFSREALWRTSEESNQEKVSNHFTQQNSTKQCRGKSTRVDFQMIRRWAKGLKCDPRAPQCSSISQQQQHEGEVLWVPLQILKCKVCLVLSDLLYGETFYCFVLKIYN